MPFRPAVARTLAATLLSLTGFAHAAVIDFEVGGAGSCYDTACLAVQGFDFSFVAGGWAVSDDENNFFNRNGRPATEGLAGAYGAGNGAPPVVITMVRSGGGTFDLSELDMATGPAGFPGSTSIELLGTLSGGGTVSETIEVTSSWASFSLVGFEGLTQLVFSNRDPAGGISIDNLNLEPGVAVVPEPGSLALCGLAGVGLWAARRRRRIG